MMILNARVFQVLIETLATSEQVAKGIRSSLGTDLAKKLTEFVEGCVPLCHELNLPVSAGVIGDIRNCKTGDEVSIAFAHAKKTLAHELKGRKFYSPLPAYQSYFENSELFGKAVFVAFPSANDDIAEAGTCLALERATACVMHLMRAIEVSLRALANTIGVPSQNDWGSYLREIDKELAKRMKSSGGRTPEEQFFAEVTAEFEAVKRAWRNPTMHVDKTYTVERAEEILRHARSFMNLLATRIAERNLPKLGAQ